MLQREELSEISGNRSRDCESVCSYFAKEQHVEEFRRLLTELEIPKEEESKEAQILKYELCNYRKCGTFANRNEVKAVIESKGGKVTGSVTSKTNYLINNDIESTSSKNKKARELGVPIISEETFLKMLEGE